MSGHNEKQYDPEMTLHQILALCQMVLMVDAEAMSDLLDQLSAVGPAGHRVVMGKMYNAHDTVVAVAEFHRRVRQIVGAEDERAAKMEHAR